MRKFLAWVLAFCCIAQVAAAAVPPIPPAVPGVPYGLNNKLPLAVLRDRGPDASQGGAVMANPPAITYGTTHTITSPRAWQATNYTNTGGGYVAQLSGQAVTTYCGQGEAPLGTTSASAAAYTIPHTVSFNDGANYYNFWKKDFMYTGSGVELMVRRDGGNFLLKIDDQYVSKTPTVLANDNAPEYIYIPFSDGRAHRIEILGHFSWGGVFGSATDTVEPAKTRGPSVIWVTDSWGAGVLNLTSPAQTWVQIWADRHGYDNVCVDGISGTGYTYNGATYSTYQQRFAADVAAYKPELMGVEGSQNDYRVSAATLQAAAALLIQSAYAAGIPTVEIMAPNYYAGGGATTLTIAGFHDALKAAAAANGARFLDIMQLPMTQPPQVMAVGSSNVSAGATSFVTSAQPAQNGQYRFADGQYTQCQTISYSNPYWTCGLDSPLIASELAGATMTQVGAGWIEGHGNTTTPTGFGSADVDIASNNHPTVVGEQGLAEGVLAAENAASTPN